MARLLKVDEVAQVLSVSKPHVYRLCNEHDLPWIIVGKEKRWVDEEINAWIHERAEARDKTAAPRAFVENIGELI